MASPRELSLTPIGSDEFDGWFAGLQERFVGLVQAGAPGRVGAADATAALKRALPDGPATDGHDLLWVAAGADRVGHVWLTYDDGDAVVRDVRLDDPAHAPVVRELVRTHVAPRAGGLEAWWTTGDASQEAFVDDVRFQVASTNMAFPFGTPQPEADGLRLRPMTPAEYDTWHERSDEDYIASRVRNGESPEHARQETEQQMADLLPHGAQTNGQAFLIGEAEGDRVGTIWLDLRKQYAFVYQVETDEAARGRGYGRALMVAGAHAAQEAGAEGIALNVFGDNAVARALYDSLGYTPTQGSVRMNLTSP